jgi:SPP1 family predicted phage head-tail adaptor
VLIQSPPTGQDSFGQASAAWTDLDTVWAEVRAQGGRESVVSQAVVGVASYRVRIRRRDDVTPAHRLVIGGLPHAISSATPDPNDKTATVILCSQGGAKG